MSLNDQIRKNSYEATLSRESSVKATAKHKMGVRKLDYAKTPEIRNQIPRGGVKQRLAEQAQARKNRGKLSLLQKRALSGWLFALPFVLGILLVYAPIIFTSFKVTMFDMENGEFTNFVGLKNYVHVLSGNDPWFHITIVDALQDLILQIPAIVIFALFMAIILNQKMTGRAAFRAIFFLPVILSTGIIDRLNSNDAFGNAVGSGSGGIDDNTGAEDSGGIVSALDIQQLLGGIKLGSGLVTYVTDLVNNIFDIVSRSGVQMLIFLSGLQSISPAIYESCQVEGASAWETFWKITLPMISPMILVNALYTVIDLFTCYDNRVMQLMEQALNHGGQYQGPLGGPSIAGSMAWIYIGLVLIFILIVALILKSVVFYQRRD